MASKAITIYSIILLYLGLQLASTLRVCDEDDLKGIYTPCDHSTQTRSMYWYYDTTNCNATGLNTPPLATNLACYVDCDAGKYLPWGQNSCTNCPAGTYSLGGGASMTHFLANWKTATSNVQIRSFCTFGNSLLPVPEDQTPPCDGWVAEGYWISSGDLKDKHDLNSIVELRINIQRPYGELRLSYMCDSERYADGLRMQIDNGAISRLANTAEFRQLSFLLSQGGHVIRFIYYKNPTASEGEDIARIDEITITGLAFADNECTKCTPGYYQNVSNSERCYECSYDSIATSFGSTECSPCPDNYYSYLGRAECLPAERPCTGDDIDTLFTECTPGNNEWVRVQYSRWVQPKVCNSTGMSLPPNSTVVCATCEPGYAKSHSGECTACALGYYSDGTMTECKSCNKEGQAAIPILRLDEWNEWPKNMSTGCVGDCTSSGWQLFSSRLQLQRPLGLNVDMWLALNVSILEGGGSVEFEFSIRGTEHSYLQFVVDGFSHDTVYKQNKNATQIVSYPLTSGLHSLSWIFHRYDPSNEDPNATASLYYIIVTGAEAGSAERCTTCPAGTEAAVSKDHCIPCGRGHYAVAGSTCQACPEGTYNEQERTGECFACGEGMTSHEGSDYCIPQNCVWTYENYVYNLSPYQGLSQFVPNSQFTGSYAISFCDRLETGPCAGHSFICEQFDRFNPSDPDRLFLEIGNYLSIDTLPPAKPGSAPEGFVLHYSGGDSEGCQQGQTNSASVTITCSTESSPLFLASSSQCHQEFVMASIFGCPMCTVEDFDQKELECENGYKIVQYIKKEGRVCNGYIQDQTKKCGRVEINLGIIIIVSVIAIIALVLLVAGLVTIFLKHRKLQHKYSLLAGATTAKNEAEENETL